MRSIHLTITLEGRQSYNLFPTFEQDELRECLVT